MFILLKWPDVIEIEIEVPFISPEDTIFDYNFLIICPGSFLQTKLAQSGVERAEHPAALLTSRKSITKVIFVRFLFKKHNNIYLRFRERKALKLK